jgi:hypothetical protein
VSRRLDIKKGGARKRAARSAAPGASKERSGRFLVSSVIKSVAYDEDAGELDITFASGKTYRYLDVPLGVYAEFLDAASKGEFFNENIKDAFRYAEVRAATRR